MGYGVNYMKTCDNVYIAIDGDSIGKLLEKYILTEDLVRLSALSAEIQQDVDKLSVLIEEAQGSVIMKGGDNILSLCVSEQIEDVIFVINQINSAREYHFSVGVAETAVNAYMALKYAKLSGNTVIRFVSDQNTPFEVMFS